MLNTIALAPLALQQPLAWQQCTQEGDTDYFGHDLIPGGAVAPGATTSEACCSACLSTTGCSTWTLTNVSVCYLKTSSLGRRASPGYLSGCVGYPTGQCAPIPDRYRCDVDGGERGVCILDRHAGTHMAPDCDGACLAAPSKCQSDWDCSLAGVCEDGSCVCDSWAEGDDCSYLSFAPVDPERVGYNDAEQSSWGGNALLGSDGQWHLYMAEIACANASLARCGLGGWFTHSQVAHAVAPHVDGPYARRALVLPTEHHNPTLKRSPADGSWNLYSISAGGGPIVVSTSLDEGATWQGGAVCTQVSTEQNPGPVLWPNRSMTMFYRADNDAVPLPQPTCSGEAIGVQYCARKNATCGGDVAAVFAHTAEDPSVFRDARGHWHMLVNALPGACLPKVQQGGHAWSRDGVTWSEPRVGAYNTTVRLANGSSMVCERRERPQMILDPRSGRPLAMTSGVTGCPPLGASRGGSDCFTLVQRMR